MKMTDTELSEIVAKIAADYGYKDAVAGFQPFKDFKIRWTRTQDWIRMDVSDYLESADEEIIASIVDTLFRKIKG